MKAAKYMSKVVQRPYSIGAGPDVDIDSILVEPSAFVKRGQPDIIKATVATRYGSLSREIDSPFFGNERIVRCTAYIDVPSWAGGRPTPMVITRGNDAGTEVSVNFSLNTDNLSFGRHIIYIQATDAERNVGSASAVFVTVEPADGDVLFEHSFETIDPQLEPQFPQCGGAAIFDPDSLFGATGKPPLPFEHRPGTTFEAVLLNGVDKSNQSIYNPKCSRRIFY